MKDKDENKLMDVLIDLGVGMNELREEMKGMRKEQQKTNLAIGELRLSYMKLDESFNGLRSEFSGLRSEFSGLRSDLNKYATRNDERVSRHEKRIIKLEESTYGNQGNSKFFAEEHLQNIKKEKTNKLAYCLLPFHFFEFPLHSNNFVHINQ